MHAAPAFVGLRIQAGEGHQTLGCTLPAGAGAPAVEQQQNGQDILLAHARPPLCYAALERTVAASRPKSTAIEQALDDLVPARPRPAPRGQTVCAPFPAGARRMSCPFCCCTLPLARPQPAGQGLHFQSVWWPSPAWIRSPTKAGAACTSGAAISKMGDRTVRHDLYMGALGGVRGHNALRQFYRASGQPRQGQTSGPGGRSPQNPDLGLGRLGQWCRL